MFIVNLRRFQKRKVQLKNVLFTWPLHNIIEDRRGRWDMIDRIGQDRIDRHDSNIEELGKCVLMSGLCVIQDMKVTTYWEKRNCILYDN